MPRPLKQGPDATDQDVLMLSKIMRRIQRDEMRSEADKKEMVTHLKAVMSKLLFDEVEPDDKPRKARQKTRAS